MTGKMVTADAQFGVARILRPFSGFRTVYSGQSVNRQIMLTEVLDGVGGAALDPAAAVGEPGYDPNLVKGLQVPFGARVVVWLPKILPNIEDPALTIRYKWAFSWRLRNVYDYRNFRTPYQYPKQGAGVPDTTPGQAGPRIVIPACEQSLAYPQTPQPTAPSARVTTNIRSEDVTTGAVNVGLPFLPNGASGVLQQGLADPVTVAAADFPFYQPVEVQAIGNELLIGLYRDFDVGPPPTVSTWDFATVDLQIGNLLGDDFPDIGVYVMVGSAP